MLRTPRPAPATCSASAAALPSLSIAHGEAEALRHPCAKRHVLERDVDRAPHDAGALVDLRRNAEPERDDALVEQSLDRIVERGEHLILRLDRRRGLTVPLDAALRVDEAGEDLRPANVHADHPGFGHSRIT